MDNISIDHMADEITNTIREYTEDVSAAIVQKVDQVADQVLSEVKSNHPYDDQSGDYTKGFKKSSNDQEGKTQRIIWNKKHYRRVHLLEFGHAKRGGGRVPAFPHLIPAYEKYGEQLMDHIKRIIQNGGGG